MPTTWPLPATSGELAFNGSLMFGRHAKLALPA